MPEQKIITADHGYAALDCFIKENNCQSLMLVCDGSVILSPIPFTNPS